MKIILNTPYEADGNIHLLAPTKGDASAPLVTGSNKPCISIEPKRYSKNQRVIFTTPFECVSDAGVTLDKGTLAVSAKTGKLTLERCSSKPVPFEVDDVAATTEMESKVGVNTRGGTNGKAGSK